MSKGVKDGTPIAESLMKIGGTDCTTVLMLTDFTLQTKPLRFIELHQHSTVGFLILEKIYMSIKIFQINCLITDQLLSHSSHFDLCILGCPVTDILVQMDV